MSKHLAELCTLLVEEIFGHLPSRLFGILVNEGRLPLPSLVQRSGLTPRSAKHGLAILVQNYLILHYTPEKSNDTTYEANTRNAYDLLRLGKRRYMFQSSFDHTAGEITDALLMHGSSWASEVKTSSLSSKHNQTEPRLTNGNTSADHLTNGSTSISHHNAHGPNSDGAHETAGREQSHEALFDQVYAVRSRKLDYMPLYDFEAMVDEKTLHGGVFGGQLANAEAKRHYANICRTAKRKSLDKPVVNYSHDIAEAAISEQSNKRGIDAVDTPSKGQPRPQKSRKLNRGEGYDDGAHLDSNVNGATVQMNAASNTINTGITVRLNNEKLDIGLRNEKLVTLCARCMGEIPAQVYEALLKCNEQKVRRCYDVYAEYGWDEETGQMVRNDSEECSPIITTAEIDAQLDPSINLTTFCDPEDTTKSAKIGISMDEDDDPIPKHKRNGIRPKFEIHDDNTDHIPPARKRRNNLLNILLMLEKHPLKFANKATDTNDQAWRVDFHRLSTALIQIELETYVHARFGPIATRIIRFLNHKGRIEEKSVANTILLVQKDVRSHLSAMQEAGIVDTQEVPKDTARQPKATIFLWFFDQERARRLLLNDMYKAMSRLLQRLKVERAQVQGVLEKASRSDVQGHEDEYLTGVEKTSLREWRKREEQILVQLGRCDDTVAVLRDFIAPMP